MLKAVILCQYWAVSQKRFKIGTYRSYYGRLIGTCMHSIK